MRFILPCLVLCAAALACTASPATPGAQATPVAGDMLATVTEEPPATTPEPAFTPQPSPTPTPTRRPTLTPYPTATPLPEGVLFYAITGAPTYDVSSQPSNVQGAYGSYRQAISIIAEKFGVIRSVCESGGGTVSALDFDVARIAINDAGSLLDGALKTLGR